MKIFGLLGLLAFISCTDTSGIGSFEETTIDILSGNKYRSAQAGLTSDYEFFEGQLIIESLKEGEFGSLVIMNYELKADTIFYQGLAYNTRIINDSTFWNVSDPWDGLRAASILRIIDDGIIELIGLDQSDITQYTWIDSVKSKRLNVDSLAQISNYKN